MDQLDLLKIGALSYPFLQFYSIKKAVKFWRYLVWVPVCVLSGFLLLVLTSSSNLWPLIMMVLMSISAVYLLIVILLLHLESRKDKEQPLSQ